MQELREGLTQALNAVSQDQGMAHEFLAEFRGLPKELIAEQQIFYSPDRYTILEIVGMYGDLDMMGFTDNSDNVFRERFVIPIYDQYRKVMALCGYDSESDIKYLFSKTYHFKKERAFYGLENISDIYRKGYAIVNEGFFDKLRVDSLGYPALALMGTFITDYHKTVLSRLDYVIFIPDNDDTGRATTSRLKALHKKTAVIILRKHKDIDEYILEEGEEGIKSFNELINQINTEIKQPFYYSKDYYL